MNIKHLTIVGIVVLLFGLGVTYSFFSANKNEILPMTTPTAQNQNIPVKVAPVEPNAEKQISATQVVAPTTNKSINAGFVFVNGHYLDAPYIITRQNGNIYINSTLVWQIIAPSTEPTIPDRDPEMPLAITKNTSEYDPIFTEYIGKKIRYVQAHHTPDEERIIMAQVYRSLPFVKEATLDPKNPDILCVTTCNEKDRWALVTPRRKGISGMQAIEREVERSRQNFEDRLSKGDTFFIFNNGSGTSFGKTKTAMELPQIVKILRSKRTVDEKIDDLHKIGCKWVDKDTFTTLITEFSASEQLEQRLATLNESQHQD